MSGGGWSFAQTLLCSRRLRLARPAADPLSSANVPPFEAAARRFNRPRPWRSSRDLCARRANSGTSSRWPALMIDRRRRLVRPAATAWGMQQPVATENELATGRSDCRPFPTRSLGQEAEGWPT